MAPRGSGARLTKRERETLELVLQGMPMERLARTLERPPKVVERHLHQGLDKLELWTQDAVPGPTYNSLQDRERGFLAPREADRVISRIQRVVGTHWAVVVVLAIAENPKRTETGPMAELISHHIHRNLRRADVVTKWSATEWVAFLPRVDADQVKAVVRRLERGHKAPWGVYIAARQPEASESFNEVAVRCHHELLDRYVSRDLAAYVNTLASMS